MSSQINREIEIGCKCKPYKIRDLEFGGDWAYSIKCLYHFEYGSPEKYKYYQGKKIVLHIKKYKRPYKIKNEL